MLRKLLITIVGHVDHGKTSLLDKIRSTTVQEREAGLITQAIGASLIPLETINRVCGNLLDSIGLKVKIPGILAIDTPGHAAFTNLRRRGGALADIAIVVVDLKEGFKPQTFEAIEILKAEKTPFIIAANKVDSIGGFRNEVGPVLKIVNNQIPDVSTKIDTKIYEIVGQMSEKFGMESERFDRIQDYSKQIAIVPTSAKTGLGIPELLMVLIALSQKYLGNRMEIEVKGPAKGTVLEVKEEKGHGMTLDVIIYDGHLKVNDVIVIGGLKKPIITKVKALFEPSSLQEMREKRTKFSTTKEVFAASGVKIIAKDIDDVMSGMPLEVANENQNEVIERVQQQVEEVLIDTDEEGVIVKADSLGSLEALTALLREHNVPIRVATIGPVTKKDIADAKVDKNPEYHCILCFNVGLVDGVDAGDVKIIRSDIIYRILEDIEGWKKELAAKLEAQGLENITRPFKLEVLQGYVFRQSNPAVFGVEITSGTARSGTSLMTSEGKDLSVLKELQAEQKVVKEAESGKQVAIAIPNITVGRQVKEGDIIYSKIREDEFRKLKELKQHLTSDEKEILRQIAEIMRRENPLWGV